MADELNLEPIPLELLKELDMLSFEWSEDLPQNTDARVESPLVNYDVFTAPDSTHTSVIPPKNNWPGKYNFKIAFQEQTEKTTKSTSWTYSETLDKLFIGMGVSCMIGFAVDGMPPPGCVIRALPIYEKSDHVMQVVKRCLIHSSPTDPSNIGTYLKYLLAMCVWFTMMPTFNGFSDHKAPEHLIRCDNEFAQYETDPNGGRQSIVVPFEGPQAGADNSQYLYRFMCLSSCTGGGITRRPLLVIFTLEDTNWQVLGRRVLRVRSCACPGRDRKTEEKNISAGKKSQKKPQALAQTTSADLLVIEPRYKKQRLDDEVYTISVRGRRNYELLLKIKQSLELSDLVPKEIVDNYRQKQLEPGKEETAGDSTRGYHKCKPRKKPKQPRNDF